MYVLLKLPQNFERYKSEHRCTIIALMIFYTRVLFEFEMKMEKNGWKTLSFYSIAVSEFKNNPQFSKHYNVHHLINIHDEQSLFIWVRNILNSVTSILIKVSFNNVLELVVTGVDKEMKRQDDIFPFVEGNVEC